MECQRAFAKPQNHRIAASLDALGNRNFAFTRQQLNRAHFAQVHANRVIGAVQLFSIRTTKDNITRARDSGNSGAAFWIVGLFGFFFLGHLNAHLGQHRHDVLNLVGGHLLRRQNRVQLIVSDVATFTGVRDHLFDCGLGHIEADIAVLVVLTVVVIFRGHAGLLQEVKRIKVIRMIRFQTNQPVFGVIRKVRWSCFSDMLRDSVCWRFPLNQDYFVFLSALSAFKRL